MKKISKLKDVTTYIARGITPKYINENGVTVLNQKCIRENTIIYANSRLHDIYAKSMSDEKILRQWDILINSTGVGTAGRTAQLKKIPKRVITVDSHVTIVRPNIDKIHPGYLGYYLSFIEEQIELLAEGSTGQTEISRSNLGELNIEYPESTNEQDAIYKILSKIDSKILFNNRTNDNLLKIVEAVFNDRFSSRIRGKKKIGDYISPKRGRALLSKDAKFGSVPVVAGGLEPATFHNASNTSAPVITISASGANAGYVNLWEIPVWSSDSSFIDTNATDVPYFWYIMLETRQKEIYDAQTGSAQAHIYPRHIEEMSVGEIDEAEMVEYENTVSPFFKEIGKNNLENQRLTKLRDTLLPELLSGKVDVSNIDI